MKRSILLFPVAAILLALSVSSCRPDAAVHDALLRAEALMETDPHAARALLDSLARATSPRQLGIRNEELKNNPADENPADESHAQPVIPNSSFLIPNFPRKGDNALYALLRTQADYKCRVWLTSDSLPLIATNYYGTKRKTQHAALAQYYLGCAYSDMHRDLDAIDALLRATTLFPDTTNKYYANSLFELGKKYMEHEMNDKAIATFIRFRNLKICEEDSVNIGYADYYMGETSLHNGDDLLADSLFHCVIVNTKFPEEYRCIAYHHLAKLYYYRWNDARSALKCLEKYNNYYNEDKHNGASFLLKADIYIAENEPSKAIENYKKSLQNSIDLYTHCSAYKGLAQAASLLNMPDSAKYYVDQYTLLLDSIYTLNRKKEIADIENNHVIELHDQQFKARHARFMLLGGTSLLFVSSAFAISLLLIDRKRKNERLRFEQELRDIKQRHIDQSIKEEPEEERDEEEESNEDGFDEGQKNNVTEVKESIPVSHHLSIQQERIALYRKEFADSRWKRFLEERKLDILSKKFMPMDEAEKFKEYLENLFADVFLDMVNDNANVTRQDIEYCAMTMLGFSTAQISYCARVSLHSLHNRRYHIKDKLTSDWYAFIFASPK